MLVCEEVKKKKGSNLNAFWALHFFIARYHMFAAHS